MPASLLTTSGFEKELRLSIDQHTLPHALKLRLGRVRSGVEYHDQDYNAGWLGADDGGERCLNPKP